MTEAAQRRKLAETAAKEKEAFMKRYEERFVLTRLFAAAGTHNRRSEPRLAWRRRMRLALRRRLRSGSWSALLKPSTALCAKLWRFVDHFLVVLPCFAHYCVDRRHSRMRQRSATR
jgi:hypothetical protein